MTTVELYMGTHQRGQRNSAQVYVTITCESIGQMCLAYVIRDQFEIQWIGAGLKDDDREIRLM